MELHIQSEFDCVYMINGEFFERADNITMGEFDIAYISVFPLAHDLLPYTLKLAGCNGLSEEFAVGIRLDEENYLLSLSPRYMTVYSTSRRACSPASPMSRLFSLIKSNNVDQAYAMLSHGLRNDITKADLISFFDGYERIAECSWTNEKKFYLIDKNGKAKPHSYTVEDGFIDDILEE